MYINFGYVCVFVLFVFYSNGFEKSSNFVHSLLSRSLIFYVLLLYITCVWCMCDN